MCITVFIFNAMELLLIRKFPRQNYTIGKLYVNGGFYCHTLEPPVRDYDHGEQKVYGNSAIPKGTYKINYRQSTTYNRKMPYLCNVPYFTGVMIHTGNTVKDTKGCILVGLNLLVGKLCNSRSMFRELDIEMQAAVKRKESITIKIEE